MSAISNKNKTRRAFFSDVTASTALAAVAMAQLGSQGGQWRKKKSSLWIV